MTYSTILLRLDDDARAALRFNLATMLARRFESRLLGLSCRRPAPWVGVAGTEFMGADPLTIELSRAAQVASEREAGFLRECDAARLATFEVVSTDDDVSRAIATHSRCADLLVLGQANPDDERFASRRDMVDKAVEQTAAPALVLPYAGHFESIGDRVLIAWSGDREGARAVADALPFLKSARAVHLVSFDTTLGESGTIDSSRLAPVVAWLASHGIKAQPDVSFTRSDIGNALLSRAADVGADLMVMGAWSHSRLAERIFGGVTRTVLDAMTVPVLMAH